MVFIAEAYGAWLIGQVAAAGHKRLTGWLHGSEQERALQQAATAAIQATAQQLRPEPATADAQGAENLARVIDQVFRTAPTPVESLAEHATLLQGLQAGVAARLAVLADADITGTGQSSADLLGINVPALADVLTRQLLRAIVERGAGGGPLTPLAAQLNFDLTHLQGQQLSASLARLTEDLQSALARPPGRHPATFEMPLRNPYLSTVHEIKARTGQLLGRQRELAEIAHFATGAEGYRWLVGGPWAGKTALLAEAVVAALPRQVDVLAYFLSRQEAEADSNRFLAEVVSQLADLLGEDRPVPDLHHFRRLWQKAAEAAATKDRHLLLVVDGLDEDLRPRGLQSVAARLPARAGGHAHVLVSSRPDLDLPVDVPVGHPLRGIRPVKLKPFKGAVEWETLAQQQLEDLQGRHGRLAVDVLGVLTVAAGPLAVEDLAALTTHGRVTPGHTLRVRRLVTEEAGRTLQPVGPRANRRYQFAHGSLLEHTQADQNLNNATYRHRVQRWAEKWRRAGWPLGPSSEATTPEYLLDAYPGTLHGDPRRLAALVGDAGWVTAAIQATGVDLVLAELRTGVAATAAAPTPLAGVAAMLATVRGQAHNLRPPQQVLDAGFVLRQLCLQAAELGEHQLAGSFRERLRALADSGLVPEWTSRRANRALVAELGGQGGRVHAVGWLPDGRVVSGGHDGWIRVWNPTTGAGPVELGRHQGVVRAVAVAPDGRVVSGGDDLRVLAWDPTIGTGPVELGRHEGVVRAVAVLPDGRGVSGGDDGRVRAWRWDQAAAGAQPTGLGRHEGAVRAVAVLPDGRVVSGDDDGRVRVWYPAAPRADPVDLGRHHGRVTAVAVLPDGRVVSGGTDGRMRVWNRAAPRAEPVDLGRHHAAVRAVAVASDGRVVSGGDDGRVRVWDPAMEAHPAEPGRRRDWVNAVALLPDGRVVSGGHDGRVRVWDPAAGAGPAELGRHHGMVVAVAVLPDGRVVSGGRDGWLHAWDPTTPSAGPVDLGRQHGWVTAVAVLPDGRVITGAHDGWIRVWDPAAPGAQPVGLGRHDGWVTAVAVLPDERVASGGHDQRVLVWDPATPGAEPAELCRHHGAVRAVGVLPDGRVVSGGHDGWIRVWDPATGAGPVDLGRQHGWVTAAAVLPDGRVVSGGTDGQLRVWDALQQRAPGLVACSVQALAVGASPAGGHLLAVAHTGTGMSIWSC